MNKKTLSEQDICSKFITPTLIASGWDSEAQIREQVSITMGRILVRGKTHARGALKRADYILFYKTDIPIAVIEVKDNNQTINAGMQQALEYGSMLQVPFVYSSNGDGFVEHDSTGLSSASERELSIRSFPSPDELWHKYCQWKGIGEKEKTVVTQDFYSDPRGKKPRYYQTNAINRAIEAISRGQNRILLVMATGTGKTYVAFQIIWRLWKARVKKRILFLVDRNFLADQAMINDFKPFGSVMTKIKNRKVDKSYEVYICLYQGISGSEEWKNIYRQFTPNFFDLIVVDECHRGSAKEDSAWREVLDYFKTATQIGLTATPKETKYISNINYFGTPVYTYSLKQGIEDGFLAPYKVIRIDLDKDLAGWRPERGKVDKLGKEIEDRIYNQKDFDRNLILEKRRELVAKKITEYLKNTGRYDKTIVFCEDIEHARKMRELLVNENGDLVTKNHKYIMNITGDDDDGKKELDNFINPENRYPTIVTTSKLLTTGADVQTCKLIVLDQNISSMSEFKQTIGRGTRVREDYDKHFFTIMDFRRATELFSDSSFDGDPVQIYEPKSGESPVPPDHEGDSFLDDKIDVTNDDELDVSLNFPLPDGKRRVKYVVDDVPVYVTAERVQYYDKNGKLITESLKDYTRAKVLEEYKSLDTFLKYWNSAEKKQIIIKELEQQGVLLEALEQEIGKDLDAFDIICHVVYGQPSLTRRERAQKVRKRNYFTKYGEQARAVLDVLLDKYADEGIENIEDIDVLRVKPISDFGTPLEIIEKFGGRDKYDEALKELEQELYSTV